VHSLTHHHHHHHHHHHVYLTRLLRLPRLDPKKNSSDSIRSHIDSTHFHNPSFESQHLQSSHLFFSSFALFLLFSSTSLSFFTLQCITNISTSDLSSTSLSTIISVFSEDTSTSFQWHEISLSLVSAKTMAKGFDDLVNWLLSEIVFGGDQGMCVTCVCVCVCAMYI
jgi:hypothetical protein